MMEEEEGQEKPYEATQRRLDQAREKGDIPRSLDLLAAATYCGFLAFALVAGGSALSQAGATLASLLSLSGSLAMTGAGSAVIGAWIVELATSLLPLFALPLLFVVGAVFAQRAWVFAPDKLEPQLSRISPLANAKQKFGRSGLFEFVKSTLKLVVISLCLGVFFSLRLPQIITATATDPVQVTGLMFSDALDFLVLVSVLALVFGGIDYLWQRAEHLRQQRMSRKELIDEMKETEGDPWIKQQRRQRGVEIAMNRMMSDLPTADVVIVNPVHVAVALKWNRAGGGAPVCVAKGVDEVALRIRAVAMDAGVPIRRDPPTARALHAAVEIGGEIRAEHYRPVAAAIRFADAMRKRAGEARR
jgi:flagellar biosynthetic protein FlhB